MRRRRGKSNGYENPRSSFSDLHFTSWLVHRPARQQGMARHSRGTIRPSFANHPPLKSEGATRPSSEGAARPQEGAGNAGCSWHPQPVCESSVHTVVTTGTPETPGIPCAMVLTAYAALSRATNSSCHPRRRIEGGARTRSGSPHLRRLDASNGRQDHTVLPYATRSSPGSFKRHVHVRSSPGDGGSSAVRLRAGETLTGIPQWKAALRHLRRPTLPRPPHPAPTFVTMANAPLTGRDGGGDRSDLGR